MSLIKKEKKQNLLNRKENRRAGFIPLKSEETKKFKYNVILFISNKAVKYFTCLKVNVRKFVQKQRLWVVDVHWKRMRNDVGLWFVECFIEGITANFATHYLLGLPFTPLTIFAHGIVIKQGLSIYWRLREHGPNPTIPTKNK